MIETVGEYLALLITFQSVRVVFFLVRWKKGEAYHVSISHLLPSFDIKAPFVQLRSSNRGTYPCFSFLTEDTLVIPNLVPDLFENILEIVRIVVDESDDEFPRLVPLCKLDLPPLALHASIVYLRCRAEPNPTGSGPLIVTAHSSRPFRDTAADAIIQFNMLTEYTADQFIYTTPFTFIVHRRALITHIPCVQRACVPFRAIAGVAPTTVPWSAWGVPVTRWFISDPSMRWIMTTAGQRAVTMEDNTPTPIIVRDFNPYAVRAALAQGRAQQECDHDVREKSWVLPNGNRQTVKVEEDVILAGSTFREDVRSALPYIETVTKTRYGYDGVLIDEERILGVEVRWLPFCVCVDKKICMLRRLAKVTSPKSVLLMFTSLGNSVRGKTR